ncbi:hypothetical protein ACFQX8_00335 [Klenkia terrae]|uniref:hypothetical protein n=1 Tax=Klenkia terrae TaxID=1052259 RepID=UPI0036067FD3
MTTSLDPAPPPTTAAPRHRWRDAALLGGALPFVLVALARSTAFAEGDTYWQITTGAEVLARRTTALVEDDSWNAAGTPWHPNSWGYDVLVDLAWRLGGWAGLGWFTVLTVSLVGVAVVVVGRRLGAAAPALAVVSTLAVVPLTAWLSARPQTVSYAALVLLVGLAARVLLGTGRRSALLGAAGLVGLTALWVNLHLAALGGFAAVAGGVGLAVLAGPVRTAVRERRWRDVAGQLVRPAVVVGAVGLGCLASPLGTGIVAAAGHTADESTALIDEWAPLWRAKPVLAMTWVAAALCLAVLVLAWRRAAAADRVPGWLPCWVGAVAVLVIGGVTAARFSPWPCWWPCPRWPPCCPRSPRAGCRGWCAGCPGRCRWRSGRRSSPSRSPAPARSDDRDRCSRPRRPSRRSPTGAGCSTSTTRAVCSPCSAGRTASWSPPTAATTSTACRRCWPPSG